MRRLLTIVLAASGSLVVAAAASAHSHVSPPVAEAGVSQVFALSVLTEEADVTTTKVELTPPEDFSIDAFVDAPGWTRSVEQTGSGEDAVVTKVTWEGGSVPTGEDATFWFRGHGDSPGDYRFSVRQTYSDGSLVDWSGDDGSETPKAPLKLVESLGGGGSSSTVGWIAVALGAVALLVALGAVATGSGRRPVA